MNSFESIRQQFTMPEGMIYLDGNSLGPLSDSVRKRVENVLANEWGRYLIQGWNKADWMTQPSRVGDRIGKLIGASANTVTVGDTLSIKVYQALAAALDMQPDRRTIVSDTGNFPTDLYMAEGLIRQLDKGHQLKLVDPQNVADALDDSVAALLLTHVDYRSGRLHDMDKLTTMAHANEIPVIWDLAHSTGALPIDLEACRADFAVGCTYKYLNAGPGAPAFIYVAPHLQSRLQPALAGWLGHEAPFAFDLDYRAGPGIERLRVGTPPVIAMAALDAALDLWDGISLDELRSASIDLSELFIHEVEARCPELVLASPRNARERGSQVSFQFEHGYAAMQALINKHQVIGDFRAPDIMRFAFTPLYIGEAEVLAGVEALEQVIRNKEWDNDNYRQVAAVT